MDASISILILQEQESPQTTTHSLSSLLTKTEGVGWWGIEQPIRSLVVTLPAPWEGIGGA